MILTDQLAETLLDMEFTTVEDEGTTLRQYFASLLTALFNEVENFSGKRPLGNSEWIHAVRDAIEDKVGRRFANWPEFDRCMAQLIAYALMADQP